MPQDTTLAQALAEIDALTTQVEAKKRLITQLEAHVERLAKLIDALNGGRDE